MSTRTRNQIIKSNEDALAAFVSKKAEIDNMLSRFQALSDDHFGYGPDEITWSYAEGLAHYARVAEAHHRPSLQRGRACRVTPPRARSSTA